MSAHRDRHGPLNTKPHSAKGLQTPHDSVTAGASRHVVPDRAVAGLLLRVLTRLLRLLVFTALRRAVQLAKIWVVGQFESGSSSEP